MSGITEVQEFCDDVQRLAKRFPNIKSDLEVFKKALAAEMAQTGLKILGRKRGKIQGSVQIEKLRRATIYKARRFKSMDLHSTGKIRVIYAYEDGVDTCTLLEIYFKGDKNVEDRQRIYKYFGQRA